ncbi:uncharacterized protein LOC106667978 isoform X2 [Cimex lectularius]|uniref:DUF229 domain containing protein n=1 Tax=Cimex lectularius TaxID=79782 RepID=A0A8I6RVY1_CIMLE|nr:uncharacterized protein LOC106667978 isoform X2 [Cimex lectularius]
MILNGQGKASIKNRNRLIRQLFFTLLVAVFCTWILFQIDQKAAFTWIYTTPHFNQDGSSSGFLVNTKGCRIHDLDPFDPSIKSYFFDEDLNCDKHNQKQLVRATTTDLYVDKERIDFYLNASTDVLHCCYQPFWRVEVKPTEKSQHFDNTYEFSDECFRFFEPLEISHEFVKVSCTAGNKTIYKDYFAFVQRKKNKSINPNDRSKVNVLTIGLDAISRLNLYRQMPKTLHLLEEMGAVEMLGYNKVEDNTFPNLVPALTGLSVKELTKECWFNASMEFDNCPFVWDQYSSIGYQTGFGEDSSTIGLFNYLKVGFRKQPTDFYLRIFNLVSEHDIGNEHWLNTDICLGNRLTIESLLDSAKSFAFNLKDILSFGFFWSNSISHDYLNLPKHGDDIHYNFIKQLQHNGILDKTVVIFMSDHGIRWGDFRSTYHGYVEERLPYLFILLPKWFNNEFPHAVSNIRRNRRRLTSPYDLHKTYQHLLDLKTLTPEALKNMARISGTKIRGTSLFLPISEERTCSDAGIPYNWCTCHQSTPEDVTNPKVIESVTHLMIYLNNFLSGYRQCSKLTVNSIIRARSERVANNENRTKHIAVTDYTVIIETKPGGGLFQATVRFFQQNGQFNVLTPVSRINTYGNQSNCISNYQLKLYCYCLNLW